MKKSFSFTRTWRASMGIILVMCFSLFSTQKALTQCNNGSAFGTFTAPTGNGVVTMSTCIFGGEYNTVNGAVAGQTYQFTGSGGAGNYLTVREGSPGGTVLGFGFSPIIVTVTVSGPIYLHMNTDAGCGTDGTCHTTTIQCTSCAGLPNDLCTGALPIACGQTITGSTAGTGIDAVPTCVTTFGTSGGVWYTFVGDGQATTLSLCGSAFDTKIGVFIGTCAALTCVTGNDDFCGLQSQVSFATTCGTSYFVLVTGFSSITGAFTLGRTCTPPDPCLSIGTLTCGGSTTVNTCGPGAFNPVSINCGFAAPGQEHIFSFTPTATGMHTLQVTDPGGYFGDYYYKLASGGCNSTGWTCIGAAIVPVSYNFGSLTAGTTYYIMFKSSDTAPASQTFQINCPASGPANDACANAILITCGQTIAGTTTDANLDGASGCGISNTAPGVWYSFIGNNGLVTLSLCGGTNYDSKLTVFSGTCTGGITCVVGNDDFCGSASQVTFNSTPGTPYLVLVHGFGSATGNFTLNVFCAAPPPCVTPPLYPTNGQANVCPLSTNLSWPASVGATSYDVYFGTTAVPPFVANVAIPIYNTGNLTPGTYFWRIAPRDSNGSNTGCSTWSFTVVSGTFVLPPNGATQVACVSQIVQPVPPNVVTNCGSPVAISSPVITNAPNPITCEGTRTFTWTYFNAFGQISTWSHVTTVERQPFTVPANGAATVACPANAIQPVPPVVQSNCGETLTPTGPVITNNPNPLACEGTRTYAWTYTDCEGNTATWSFVYTVERQPFTVPANGGATVACPAQTDTAPTPPVVTSNCGEVLAPVISISPKPICEGTRTYTYTYTDCEGNTAQWRYIYTVEYQDFIVPTSIVGAVECPVNAFKPTPPAVNDNCGNMLVPVGPTVTNTTNASGCEGSRKYEWIYTDCEGNSNAWSQTFLFEYNGDFFAPLDEENYVTCLAYAVAPFPQTLTDYCGQTIKVSGPIVEENIAEGGCTGWRKFSYVYTDCGGHSHPWSFTYYIDDNEGPLGTCASSSTNDAVSVSVSNLSCIEEVPCPDDHDFTGKIQELIENGNYYDVCSGGAIKVTLESWSDLWECSDPDGNGVNTFGRTFYFLIADACGNEAASLCEITYSGTCLPLASFVQSDWGIAGGAPGSTISGTTTDLQVISTLIGNTPIVIGGGFRSLTIDDPQCVVNLLPGIGGPGILANCNQLNCTGCNPLGIGGMKNALAANAIALTLNMRYNIQYNGMTLNAVRSQSLDCIGISPNIVACDSEGENCKLRVFDQQGVVYEYPYTIGGLLDLANFYLGGNIRVSIGQGVLYSTGLKVSLQNVNAYWSDEQFVTQCGADAGTSPIEFREKALQANGAKDDLSFSLAPNPAGSEVTLQVSELEESQDVVFELYNSLGQQVLRKDFGRVSFVNERIDLGGIGNGMYLVSVKVGGQRYEQKLVVSKD